MLTQAVPVGRLAPGASASRALAAKERQSALVMLSLIPARAVEENAALSTSGVFFQQAGAVERTVRRMRQVLRLQNELERAGGDAAPGDIPGKPQLHAKILYRAENFGRGAEWA